MVADELAEVFAGFFELQEEDESLLRPVACLEQVVGFEYGLVGTVRVIGEEGGGVEVPHRRSRHDIKAERAENGKVAGGVHLLHESGLFAAAADPESDGERSHDALHQEFACEGEDDDVEDDEQDIATSFAITGGTGEVGRGEGVGEEDERVDEIGG